MVIYLVINSLCFYKVFSCLCCWSM